MINKNLNCSAVFLLQYFLKKKYPNIELIDYNITDKHFYFDFFSKEKINKKTLNFFFSELNELKKNNKHISLTNNIATINDFSLPWKDTSTPTTNIKILNILNISSITNKENTEKNATRITGITFSNKQEELSYKNQELSTKKKDHRHFGAELCLFDQDILIGQGLPIWLNKGYEIKKKITQIINQIQIEHGVQMVSSPILGSKELYITSGHWDHYQNSIFPPIEINNEEYILRPMTCPHHIVIFKKNQHSYKELPYLIGENALLHRYESSGGLLGLERVRSMELIDTHAFLTFSQIYEVFEKCYSMIKKTVNIFDIKFTEIHLSINDKNDSKKFYNDPIMWEKAIKELTNFLIAKNIKYELKTGDAAFYGPKIDFQIKTILGKIITISTIQLDFLLADKFKIKYKDSDGEFKTPVIIHLGIIGTIERFFALLLEQHQGNLPFWLLSQQAVIIPISSCHNDYAETLKKEIKELNINVSVDSTNERFNKKILNNQKKKIPFLIFIGDKEIENKELITYRCTKTNINITEDKQIFFNKINNLNKYQ